MFMKYFFLLGLLLTGMQLRAQLQIGSGTEIKLTGNVIITLQDINLVNNGTINVAPGEGTFRFSGTGNNTISGTNAPLFDRLQIAKIGTSKISLLRNINIGSSVNFVSGELDLNNNNIFLATLAVVEGESETSRIITTNGGFIEIATVLNNPSAVNPGNLGVIISSSANLGTTIIRRGHQSQTNVGGAGNSIFRYYDILPTNNTALNATLRINYVDAELNGLTETSLALWRSVNSIDWFDQGFNARNTITNYVQQSGIASFSRWTLASSGNPLPVVFLLFNVKCVNDKVELHWKTASEQNSNRFEVQRSVSGSNWVTIGTLPAAGNSSTERSYSFTDLNPVANNAFYRIAEVDHDGRIQYSSIIRNECGQPGNIKLWPNPVVDQLYVSIHSSNGAVAFINLYDAKGGLIKRQQAALLSGNNQVPVDMKQLPNAVYHVIVSWNQGKQQQSFQVVKQ
jgi:hypothetical protein